MYDYSEYVIQYEKTLPPWYIGEEQVRAEDSQDAVKEFYKHHDSFEERVRSVREVKKYLPKKL